MKGTPMKVALFVPCYIDQFYPQVGIASLELLEKLGCEVAVPARQTCCGQPLGNSGFEAKTIAIQAHFKQLFEEFSFVVCPSASCALHLIEHSGAIGDLKDRVYEICDFIDRYCDISGISAKNFDRPIGFHHGCHGLRGLRLSKSSERMEPAYSVPEKLLSRVSGLKVTPLMRVDECCGFGGTFSVTEEAVSVMMGEDRLADHLAGGAEVIVSTDMSCLMHLQGLADRAGQQLEVKHVVELLNSGI